MLACRYRVSDGGSVVCVMFSCTKQPKPSNSLQHRGVIKLLLAALKREGLLVPGLCARDDVFGMTPLMWSCAQSDGAVSSCLQSCARFSVFMRHHNSHMFVVRIHRLSG